MRRVHVPKVRFTAEEDRMLTDIISRNGPGNWDLIAKEMQTRTARQCRERWVNYISPDLSNSPWTEAEDEILDDLYHEYGTKWTTIAEYFPNRSPNSVRNRIKLKERNQNKLKNQTKFIKKTTKKQRKGCKIQELDSEKEVDTSTTAEVKGPENNSLNKILTDENILRIFDNLPEASDLFM